LKQFIDSVIRLENYCVKNNYRGYDPYDALKSPLFNLPLLKNAKLIRFGIQQLVKRSPVNLRPLLMVPKGLNPVTLGLFIQGYTFLFQSSKFKVQKEEYLKKIQFLIEELKKQIPQGYHGACWGYDFPWEARYASIPAYQPTVVATGIISNALFECFRITGNETAKELCISSADFVLHDLNRTYEDDSFCFSYSPVDKQQVFNANMKGIRLLAQVFSMSQDEKQKTEASQAVKYVISNQNNDGSWFYSKTGTGKWIDNYHTGYILDCLDEYRNYTGDTTISSPVEKGFRFYRSCFIEPDGKPRFYNNRAWPVDCTAAAQSVLTLCRFGDVQTGTRVAEYMIDNMQSGNGGFYFRKYKFHTEKTKFMRWSNAWMFAALSYLIMKSDK